MESASSDWQSGTALAVVAITAIVFALRIALRKKNKSGCAGDCGCAKPDLEKRDPSSST